MLAKYIGLLPLKKGQCFVLTGYRLSFSVCNASAKMTISRFIKCLIYHHDIPHKYTASIQLLLVVSLNFGKFGLKGRKLVLISNSKRGQNKHERKI